MKRLLGLLAVLAFTIGTVFAAEVETRHITVLGKDKQPIAAARVIVLDDVKTVETNSDQEGRIIVPVEPTPGTFLFVDHDGYRFHGQLLEKADADSKLQLTADDQPSPQPLVGKDWVQTRQQRQQIFHDLLDPFLEYVLTLEKDVEKLRPLESLAKTDPARTLEILQSKPFKQAQMNMVVKGRAMEGLAEHDCDAALELAESFDDAYMRCYSMADVTRRSTEMPKEDKREWLVRAAGEAKSIKNPGQRIAMIAVVAGALIDIGEREAAEKLLRDSQATAEGLPNDSWASFARGSFAEQLMVVDFDAALPLISGLAKKDSQARHFGNAAHRLAATNPAQAERVLNLIETAKESRYVIFERDQYVPRVCYRMATHDLDRAKKIARSCQEVNFQAYSLGVMAHGLGPDQRQQATDLLREAFALLEDGIRDVKQVKIHASSIAGALLPTVERIDRELVREMFWRTVSLRTATTDEQQFANWSDSQTAYLATWLSRYDRDTAGVILEHWHSQKHQPYTRNDYAVALSLTAPAKAALLAKSLDKPDQPSGVRHSVAKHLLMEGTERLRIPHQMTGVWPIDATDVRW